MAYFFESWGAVFHPLKPSLHAKKQIFPWNGKIYFLLRMLMLFSVPVGMLVQHFKGFLNDVIGWFQPLVISRHIPC